MSEKTRRRIHRKLKALASKKARKKADTEMIRAQQEEADARTLREHKTAKRFF